MRILCVVVLGVFFFVFPIGLEVLCGVLAFCRFRLDVFVVVMLLCFVVVLYSFLFCSCLVFGALCKSNSEFQVSSSL